MKQFRLPKSITDLFTLENYLDALYEGHIYTNTSYAKRSLRKWEVLIAYAIKFNAVPNFRGLCALCKQYHGEHTCTDCILLNPHGQCCDTPTWLDLERSRSNPTQWIKYAKEFYEWIYLTTKTYGRCQK